MPVRDCGRKYNVYLLYAHRPKDLAMNYSVRIDVYNQVTLDYRGSWLFPVQFRFLPVYPLPVLLKIPPLDTAIIHSCNASHCGTHGRCVRYVNREVFDCQCDSGWSGRYCQLQHSCPCSIDGLCLSSDLCVCRVGKFGARCFLTQPPCQCEHGGTCIRNDQRLGDHNEPLCICADGFSGARCETRDTAIEISFGPAMAIPQSFLVHYIRQFGKK